MLITYIIKFTVKDSKEIITNSYNPRLNQDDENIKRGSILDCNEKIIAESIKNETGYERIYNYPLQFSHIVGFNSNGKSGIESKYNFEMEKLDNSMIQRLSNIILNKELMGNSLVLTLDADLQNYVYEKLGNKKGAIVVVQPSTGKILSMVSYPNFNPKTIYDDWKNLISDSKNTPLVNRASMGLYPPGSVFKIITSGALLESKPQLKDLSINCKGEITINDVKVRCFDNIPHGYVNLENAFEVSCNSYFANLGTTLEISDLKNMAEKALFNKTLSYPLEYKKSTFSLSYKSETEEIMHTAMGQGRTLITPLHCTLITSAIANNGVMMKPYLLDHIKTYKNEIKNKTTPEIEAKVFSPNTAQNLKLMMGDVVTSGTGIQAKIDGISVAGKTGTAETGDGKDHAWFTAFAPTDNPQIAISIMLENAGSGSNIVLIAKDIIKYYLK